MKKVLSYLALSTIFLTSGCISKYASQSEPVVFNAPAEMNDVELAKTVLYSLARRHWSIEYYDLTSIDASYRRLPIHVEMKAGKTIIITHRLGDYTKGSNARYFKKWFANLERTILQVALYEEEDQYLDEKLRKYGISPSRIDRLGAELGNEH